MELKKENIKINDYQMIMHMSFSTKHYLKHSGILSIANHPLNGKKFFQETVTPINKRGEYGNPKHGFFLDAEKSTIYKDLFELIKTEGAKLEAKN